MDRKFDWKVGGNTTRGNIGEGPDGGMEGMDAGELGFSDWLLYTIEPYRIYSSLRFAIALKWAFIFYHYYRVYYVYNEIRVFVSAYVWMVRILLVLVPNVNSLALVSRSRTA